MRKRSALALLLLFGVFGSPLLLLAANPGTITLAVDATDTPRNLFYEKLAIPVTP